MRALGVKDQGFAIVLGNLHSNWFSSFCFKLVSILAVDLVRKAEYKSLVFHCKYEIMIYESP